jgi:hypothetical protein
MLETVVRALQYSPSAFRASLQTSTVDAGNRTTGGVVGLIKKIDMPKHFAARRVAHLIVASSVNQLDASGIPEIRSHGASANAPGFVADFSLGLSSSGVSSAPGE